jgi:beta-phosphoglucomutase family hydrolase
MLQEGDPTMTQRKSAPFAVLWDMDGVIVDSGPYHFQAWKLTFKECGITFDETDFQRTFGRRNDSIILDMMGPGVSPEQAEAIADTKEQRYRALVKQKSINALPGALEWIRALHEQNVPQAIVSSAPPENITTILMVLEATDLFQVLISGEKVERGKPDPESFLLAAAKLGLSAKQCIVIEDAPAGIEAARRAGMRCLAVTTSHPAEHLADADRIVGSLDQLPIDIFEQLLEVTPEDP